MSHYVVPPSVYVKAAIALAVLMALTIFAAFIDMGSMNPVVAMTISVAKAVVIVLFFMNVKYSSRLTWVFVGGGFFWLIILFGMLMPDYVSRDWQHQGQPWAVTQQQAPAHTPEAPAPQP
ncbi:MAG: cytochrome C oxidase subunit IV family protein [Candidatus Hydrogenedentes bacterium]|nr:cytochrome C oxidase subunit IV family protein [Candidatus Hydrogenedentota bacterium]